MSPSRGGVGHAAYTDRVPGECARVSSGDACSSGAHGRNGRDPAVDQEVCPDDVRRIVRREVNRQLRDFQRIGHPLAWIAGSEDILYRLALLLPWQSLEHRVEVGEIADVCATGETSGSKRLLSRLQRPLIQAADGDARALSVEFLRRGQPDPAVAAGDKDILVR